MDDISKFQVEIKVIAFIDGLITVTIGKTFEIDAITPKMMSNISKTCQQYTNTYLN